MQDLFSFIQSTEAEVSTVLKSLRVVLHYTSCIRDSLDDVQKMFEEFAGRDSLEYRNGQPCDHFLNSVELVRLLKITKELESEVRSTLGLAGVRLDDIRGKVIGAKERFCNVDGAEKIFRALEKLISELDSVCVSLASNMSKVSMAMKQLGSK